MGVGVGMGVGVAALSYTTAHSTARRGGWRRTKLLFGVGITSVGGNAGASAGVRVVVRLAMG